MKDNPITRTLIACAALIFGGAYALASRRPWLTALAIGAALAVWWPW